MTRKFTLRQNCSTSADRQHLLCQGHGYDADSSTTASSRRPEHIQRSRIASGRSGLLPPSISTGLVAGASHGWPQPRTPTGIRPSASKIAQSMSVQSVQLRRTTAPLNATKSSDDTTIYQSPKPSASNCISRSFTSNIRRTVTIDRHYTCTL